MCNIHLTVDWLRAASDPVVPGRCIRVAIVNLHAGVCFPRPSEHCGWTTGVEDRRAEGWLMLGYMLQWRLMMMMGSNIEQ